MLKLSFIIINNILSCKPADIFTRTYSSLISFSSPFPLRFSESGLYIVPQKLDRDDIIEYIRSLPINPNPEVFGLHENADITKDNQETQQVSDVLNVMSFTIL